MEFSPRLGKPRTISERNFQVEKKLCKLHKNLRTILVNNIVKNITKVLAIPKKKEYNRFQERRKAPLPKVR